VDTLRERRDRLADTLTDLAQQAVTPDSLARAAAEALGMDAAAITVAGPLGKHLLGAHGSLAARLETAQRRLDEGPTMTALAKNGPIFAIAAGLSRWPQFEPVATASGLAIILALPLHPRRALPAALSLYRTTDDRLQEDDFGNALLFSDLVAEALANSSPDGLRQRLGHVGEETNVVHRATGIVAARQLLTPAEALSTLRERAATSGRSLAQVATEIVD